MQIRPVLFALVTAISGIAGLTLATGTAFAQPAALLLDIQGEIDPALEPYEEVDAEEELELSDGTELTFTHYGKCETVTVTGGFLYIRGSEWLLRKGKVGSVERGDCPDIVEACSGADCQDNTLGGVVLRSIMPEPQKREIKVSAAPALVLTGAAAKDIAEIALYDQDGRLLNRRAAQKGRNDWPKDQDALGEGNLYFLDLLPRPGGKSYRITLMVSPSAGDTALIRVD